MKKKKKRGRPATTGMGTKENRIRYSQINEMRHLNLALTPDEDERLGRLAELWNARKAESAYTALVRYLHDCADADDVFVVVDPERILRDKYWGTPRESEWPRNVPKFFQHKSDRTVIRQQFVTNEGLLHIRALSRYFRVPVADLIGSAIDYMYEASGA